MFVYILKHYTLHEGYDVVGVFSSLDKVPKYKDGDWDWYSTEEFELDKRIEQ